MRSLKSLLPSFLLLATFASIHCGCKASETDTGTAGDAEDPTTNPADDGGTPSLDGGATPADPKPSQQKVLFFNTKKAFETGFFRRLSLEEYRPETNTHALIFEPSTNTSIESKAFVAGKLFFAVNSEYYPFQPDQLWVYDPSQAQSTDNPRIFWTAPNTADGKPQQMRVMSIEGKLYASLRPFPSDSKAFEMWLLDPQGTNHKKLFSYEAYGVGVLNGVQAAGKIIFHTYDKLLSWDPTKPASANNPRDVYAVDTNGNSLYHLSGAIGKKVYFFYESAVFEYDASAASGASNPRPVTPKVALFAIHASKIYAACYIDSTFISKKLCVFDPSKPVSATNPKQLDVFPASRTLNVVESVGNSLLLLESASPYPKWQFKIYDPSLALSSANPQVTDVFPGEQAILTGSFALDGDRTYYSLYTYNSAGGYHHGIALLDPSAPIQASINPNIKFPLPQGVEAVEILMGTF